MANKGFTIWCNARLPSQSHRALHAGMVPNRLVVPINLKSSNLVGGDPDPLLENADIAFGQPDAEQIIRLPRLKWVHLTSAGYTRYDRDDLRQALKSRGAHLTNSSAVYTDPCAEHVLAMMMSITRQLPRCLEEQLGDRGWRTAQHRMASRLLRKQTALILGFGSIGHRLVELLQPFEMSIFAMRRKVTEDESVKMISQEELDEFLPRMDHIINILPDNPTTVNFFNAERLSLIKRHGVFYNIGRGTTVDQAALTSALNDGKLSAAYLDVTDPEPLPHDSPLWSAKNCYITPHTAGGHYNESDRLVKHFLNNLERFQKGKKLRDRVI